MDPLSGAITATTDLGKAASDLKWSADIKSAVLPIRSLAFDCEEFSLSGLYDPRFLQTLGEVIPLDATRNAEPQRFGMWMDNRMMAGFVEPGTPVDLLIRYGRVGNRVILVNMPDKRGDARAGEGRGFLPRQLNIWARFRWRRRYFYRLDDERLTDYRRAGVSSSLIDGLHDEARQQIASAETSLNRDDGVGLMRRGSAWANGACV